MVNSRYQRRSNQVWRRRRCVQCRAVFTTQETPSYEGVWRVRSPAGVLEPFSRDKLLLSLYESCRHRKTALSDARGLTETIIKKLQAHMADGTVTKRVIAQVAQVALNRFDGAASVHYRAFHAS